jgi:hypothetical protein
MSVMQYFKTYFSDRNYLFSLFGAFVLLGISLVTQFFINGYVTRSISGPVADIILSNTRVYDVGGIFVWGAVILTFLGFFIAIKNLNFVPFALKSIAIFTLIRSVFISLTHISPFPTHAIISSTFFNKEAFSGIFTGNDLFFSGHTGIPFLLTLMFWNVNKKLRYFFLGFSFLFAVVVLLGHLHYSIDVLSAFFITYSIFDLCKYMFKKDWQLLQKKNHETL